jgi:DNA adenine methylase
MSSSTRERLCPDDHRKLLTVLKQCKGMVMISGYPSELYDRELAGWTRNKFNLAAQGRMRAER